MPTLPAKQLFFYDTTGTRFGVLYLAPSDEDPSKGDCIFDMSDHTESQDCLSEVRWLSKRHYQRWSEHRFALDDDGVLTIRKASFELHLDPTEDGGFLARPPAPIVTATWGE